MNAWKWIIVAVGLPLLAGCTLQKSISDPDPAEKIPAIKQAACKGDRKTIPELVVDLDSDDSAVRFYAIGALHDLTKMDFGYRYYDDSDARKPALKQWNDWLAKKPSP